MKKAPIVTMVLLGLSLISLNLTGLNSVQAAPTYSAGSFWANHFGMKLTRIKTPDDILKNLTFSPKHLAEIKADITSNKITIPDVTYKVFMSQIYIIKDKRNKTVIDFEKFNQNKILLNNKPIVLNPNKTFEDYKIEVAKILQPLKKVGRLDFIFTKAYAQSEDQGFIGYVASIFGSSSDARNLRGNDLKGTSSAETVTDTLIKSYTYEERLAKKNANGGPTNLTTLVFYCENNNLVSVQERVVVKNGRQDNGSSIKDGRKLSPQPGGGYKFIHGNYGALGSGSCMAMVDDNGVVLEIAENSEVPARCPKKNLNIFNDPIYFGGYPKEASTCCRTKGCYEAVVAKRNQMVRSLTGQAEPVAVPVDSKSNDSESVE